MTQDGLISFEPAFADELAIVMKWGFEHMQAKDGGATYLRLTTRPLEHRHITTDLQGTCLPAPTGGVRRGRIASWSSLIRAPLRIRQSVPLDRLQNIAVMLLCWRLRLRTVSCWPDEAQARRGDSALSHIELMLDRVPQLCFAL